MRAYGRITNANGTQSWIVVQTDPNGFNDAVYVTWLAQVLKLNTNESPFYGAWGLPQQQTIVTQVFPDFYVMQTQQNFAGLFAYLAIARAVPTEITPVYKVSVTFNSGASIIFQVPT